MTPGLLYPGRTLTFAARREGARYLKQQGFRYDWSRLPAWPVCFYRHPSPDGPVGAAAILQPSIPFRISGAWMATLF